MTIVKPQSIGVSTIRCPSLQKGQNEDRMAAVLGSVFGKCLHSHAGFE
jgi:hypothetical protein